MPNLLQTRARGWNPSVSQSPILLVGFVVLVFSFGCAGTSIDLAKTMQTLAEEKSKAESAASILKRGWASESSEVQVGARYYNEAKAAFDGLIARISEDTSAQDITIEVQKAGNLSDRFAHYVYTLQNPDVSSSWTVVIAPLVAAVIQLWETYQKAEDTRRVKIRQDLEKLQWTPFDQIPSKKPSAVSKRVI